MLYNYHDIFQRLLIGIEKIRNAIHNNIYSLSVIAVTIVFFSMIIPDEFIISFLAGLMTVIWPLMLGDLVLRLYLIVTKSTAVTASRSFLTQKFIIWGVGVLILVFSFQIFNGNFTDHHTINAVMNWAFFFFISFFLPIILLICVSYVRQRLLVTEDNNNIQKPIVPLVLVFLTFFIFEGSHHLIFSDEQLILDPNLILLSSGLFLFGLLLWALNLKSQEKGALSSSNSIFPKGYQREISITACMIGALIPFFYFKSLFPFPLDSSSDLIFHVQASWAAIYGVYPTAILSYPGNWNVIVGLVAIFPQVNPVGIYWWGSLLSLVIYSASIFLLLEIIFKENYKVIIAGTLCSVFISELGAVLNIPNYFGAGIIMVIFPILLLLIEERLQERERRFESKSQVFQFVTELLFSSYILFFIHTWLGTVAIFFLVVYLLSRFIPNRYFYIFLVFGTGLLVSLIVIQVIFPVENIWIFPFLIQGYNAGFEQKVYWLLRWYSLPLLLICAIGWSNIILNRELTASDKSLSSLFLSIISAFFLPLAFIYRIISLARPTMIYVASQGLSKSIKGKESKKNIIGVFAIISIASVMLLPYYQVMFLNPAPSLYGSFDIEAIEWVRSSFDTSTVVISDPGTSDIAWKMGLINFQFLAMRNARLVREIFISENNTLNILNSLERSWAIIISGRTTAWLLGESDEIPHSRTFVYLEYYDKFFQGIGEVKFFDKSDGGYIIYGGI
ncbi:MAG: hypothetical protein ACFFBD_12995 [Candidatus Hodarchaeota archaeon]